MLTSKDIDLISIYLRQNNMYSINVNRMEIIGNRTILYKPCT